ncbi:ImmA/IrrE family metallo-endopeptidase [Paenibacillus sp. IB182496]|uniref:ImmA/IrrE family metallo-endopeptidase n=1 Tax=Paenibacillus sabuli TaxID=2772509 RepID=A0A927GS19_9BACL|nr:XRE family transcriptional regulator [Paenibacillus sabuli]MBD2846254.1 ImmA/IrrE family metallo-endopeptidase [Paenibacillus sabuli]
METTTKNEHYNYKMVVLARESRGLAQKDIAELSGISQGKISKLENGLIPIADEEIQVLSSVMDYPLSFFKRTDRIYGVGISEYFHRKRQSVSQKSLNKIYAKLEIRRIEIAALLKSVDIGDVTVPAIDPEEYDNDIETIAQVVRANWRVPKGPIDNVVELIEEAGAVLVPFDFEKANVDGISLWHPGMPPLIFVNFDRPMDRIRFTICHELGHLVLHRNMPSNGADIEEQADRFASEFLMPAMEIAPLLRGVSIQKLASLKPYWKTSMSSMLKKSIDLGYVNERNARYFWMQMNKLGYRTTEPPELSPPIEKPQLLDDIVSVYQNDFKYSVSDICKVLSLNYNEVKHLYFKSDNNHLRLIK